MRSARGAGRPVGSPYALIGVLLLAGCSGGAALPEPSPGSTLGPLETIVVLADPLAGADLTAPSYLAQMVDENNAREDAVAACMAQAGWDYQPMYYETSQFHLGGSGIALDSREFAERYGFGIASGPEDGTGYGWTAEGVDPNWDYVQSLSDDARAQWDAALHGNETIDEDTGLTRFDGCATAGTPLEHPTGREASLYLSSVRDQRTDAAFGDLQREWSACLREAGFELTAPESARAELAVEFDAEYAKGEPVPDEWREAFAAREVEAALASWDCRESLDYDARARKIQVGLEQQWVDEHRGELEAWVASLEG